MGEKARLRAEVERLREELTFYGTHNEWLLTQAQKWQAEARLLRDKYEPHNRPKCNRVLDDGEPCGVSVLPGCERCFECELWTRRLSDE